MRSTAAAGWETRPFPAPGQPMERFAIPHDPRKIAQVLFLLGLGFALVIALMLTLGRAF